MFDKFIAYHLELSMTTGEGFGSLLFLPQYLMGRVAKKRVLNPEYRYLTGNPKGVQISTFPDFYVPNKATNLKGTRQKTGRRKTKMTKLDMQLEVSEKTSFEAPIIKKGYYAAKLIEVKKHEKDGKEVEDQYGKSLIFQFAIYKKDEADQPTEPVKITKNNISEAVNLSQFVNYVWKKNGEFVTAITMNSKLTKLLKALGWEFDPKTTVNPSDFIGKWCEVNVDDHKKEVDGVEIKKSIIKDFGPLEVKQPPKKLKVEDVSPEGDTSQGEESEKIKELEKKKVDLKKHVDDGILSQDGYDKAVEQIDAQIEELKK